MQTGSRTSQATGRSIVDIETQRMYGLKLSSFQCYKWVTRISEAVLMWSAGTVVSSAVVAPRKSRQVGWWWAEQFMMHDA